MLNSGTLRYDEAEVSEGTVHVEENPTRHNSECGRSDTILSNSCYPS